MTQDTCVLRVFDVRARAGCEQALKDKLSATSITVVDGKPGNRGFLFGEVVSEHERDFVFISVWEDLAAVQAVFGESWQQSYLPPGYAELIEHCSIRHLTVAGKLDALGDSF